MSGSAMNEIQIYYRNKEVEELYAVSGCKTKGSAGFDLVLAQDLAVARMGDYVVADLGVVIRPPEGCHSLLMPRSSTFMRYNMLQTNGVGLIDSDYCGENDFWGMPLVYFGNSMLVIPKGVRIAQLVLCQTIPITGCVGFNPSHSRGGFGSTGE